MDEIEVEVGEYVRTYQGNIGKVKTITSTGIIIEDERHIHFDGITKHSFNIIDLIEVGDYVNGEVVEIIYSYDEDGNDKDELGIKEVDCEEGYYISLKDIEIKSVVTHEQFNSVKYTVM